MIYVTTSNDRRRARWEAIFGADRLPVRQAHPRPRETRDGAQMAYDLDVARLHDMQLRRLAAAIARETRRSYDDVLFDVRQGWPVVADGLTVIVGGEIAREATAVTKRPFAFVKQWLRRRFQPAA